MEFSKLNGYTVKDAQARQDIENLYVESVEKLIETDTLKSGDVVKTLGYYSANDGGGATYLIRDREEADIESNGFIHLLDNGLVAELITNNEIDIRQVGCRENDEVSQKIMDLFKIVDTVYVKDNTYLLEKILYIPTNKKLYGNSGPAGKTTFKWNGQMETDVCCVTIADPTKTTNGFGDVSTKQNIRVKDIRINANGQAYGFNVQGATRGCVFDEIQISNFTKGGLLIGHNWDNHFGHIEVVTYPSGVGVLQKDVSNQNLDMAMNNTTIDNLTVRDGYNGIEFNSIHQSNINSLNVETMSGEYSISMINTCSFFPNIHIENEQKEGYVGLIVKNYQDKMPTIGSLQTPSIKSERSFIILELMPDSNVSDVEFIDTTFNNRPIVNQLTGKDDGYHWNVSDTKYLPRIFGGKIIPFKKDTENEDYFLNNGRWCYLVVKVESAYSYSEAPKLTIKAPSGNVEVELPLSGSQFDKFYIAKYISNTDVNIGPVAITNKNSTNKPHISVLIGQDVFSKTL